MSEQGAPGSGDFRKRRGQVRGRVLDPGPHSEIRALLAGAARDRDLLIEHLHKIQDAFGHISSQHIAALATEMKLSQAEVYEVATFYHHFDVVREGEKPPLSPTVRVCRSLACRMAGAEDLTQALQNALGQTVRIQAVPCVGRCQHAPVAVVGKNPLPLATVGAVSDAITAGTVDAPVESYRAYAQYRAEGGYRLYHDCRQGRHTPAEIVAMVSHAGLRGLGGAGFPVGRKWRIVGEQPAPRLMVVNIDEGEPGTFKDRHYLETDPHRFLEGMLLAAWAVAIDSITIYLRDEYAGCRQILEQEVACLRAAPPSPASLPAIHLRRGAGAYVCGEESAMIESIEGRRGMPRLRPPFVAEVGLFGRPTLVHNLESLYWLRDIVERGPDWFAGHGRRGRQGLRSFSVSGRIKRPGVHLAPAGISVRELIDEFCGGMLDGHRFYGYFPGGASGGMLPAALGDVPLDFDTLSPYGCFIGSAGIVVFSHHDRARDLACNTMEFFADESCGKCTPCRAGTAKALALMRQAHWPQDLLQELATVMSDASICGLGQAAPNALRCALAYFPDEFK